MDILNIMDADNQWLFATMILTGVSLILLPYLCYLFWKSRHHFLISPRFPRITILVSILMFIASIEAIFIGYLLDVHNKSVEEAVSSTLLYPIMSISANIFAFIFCSFLVFRALLFYDKWLTSQHRLNNQSSVMSSHPTKMNVEITTISWTNSIADSSSAISILMHYLKKPLLRNVFILILFLFILMCSTVISKPYPKFTILGYLFRSYWAIFLLLCIFILIKSRKSKESLLCFRETYSLCILIVVQMVFTWLTPLIGIHIRSYLHCIVGM